MRYAIVKDGACINVIEAADNVQFPEDWTAIASESASPGDLFDAVSGEFSAPEPQPPLPPTVEEYTAAIDKHVDGMAQAKQYGNAVSLVSYAQSTNPQWAAEAAAFIEWRDAVWHFAYTTLAAVQNGEHEAPGIDAFIAELPAIEWPVIE